jgi:hypothetical protein
MLDLLPMHIAGTDRANEAFAIDPPDGESHEYRPGPVASPDHQKPDFGAGVRLVRKHVMRPAENRLDLGKRHAMLFALGSIAVIPIEACYGRHINRPVI